MYSYLNGYDKFIVTCKKAGQDDQVFNFTMAYKALIEYYEKVSTMEEWDTGGKSKVPHFIRLKWYIDFEDRIDNPDLKNWLDIENLELEGWEIWLMPHKDIEARFFRVLFKDEERAIGLMPHFNGLPETSNNLYHVTLLNADPVLRIPYVDPNVYVAGIGGSTDPEGPVEGLVQ